MTSRLWVCIPDPGREHPLFEVMFRSTLYGARNGLYGGLVMGSTIAWMFWNQRAHAVFSLWFYALALAIGLRFVLLYIWSQLPNAKLGRRHAYTATVLYLIVGIIWGLAGWVFNADGANWARFALLTCQYLLLAMSVIALSSYLPVYLAFVTPLCMLIPLPWMTYSPNASMIVAIGTLASYFVCFSFAIRISRTQAESIELRLELTASNEQLRVKTEAAEAAQREAEQANLAKTKFLAAASHDLRQPTHAIGMFIATLHAMSLRPAIDPGEIAYIAERLQTTFGGLGHLLTALLDISMLDAGVIQSDRQPVILAQKLETLYNIFSGLATAKNLELRIMPCSLAVDTDPFLLHRILCNLVANAVRYTEHGRILVGCRRRKNSVEIQVWDTGIGISQDQIGKIFTEFFQVANAARNREKGLGLGLSIVQRSAEILGTKIMVASVPGKGSVFSLVLPLTDTGHKFSSGLPLSYTTVSMTILVIDDDRAVLDAVHDLLTAWGHVAICAASLNEAFATAKCTPAIGFILADYRLAGDVTGVDAIRAVFACLGRAIPAAIITGDTDPERIREASKSGYTVLHKPLAAAQLRELLDRTTGSPVQTGT